MCPHGAPEKDKSANPSQAKVAAPAPASEIVCVLLFFIVCCLFMWSICICLLFQNGFVMEQARSAPPHLVAKVAAAAAAACFIENNCALSNKHRVGLVRI